jgi:hypothetical protein
MNRIRTVITKVSETVPGYLVGALLTATLMVGCSGGEAAESSSQPADQRLTYYRDAKPILDAKCATCHVEGGIAPFSLTDYASASPYAAEIKTAVTERTMPPWPPGEGCADYLSDRSLTAEQIATLTRWVDDGAIEGDPAAEGPPVDKGPQSMLSRVDRTLAMPEAYTPTSEPDDYRCFAMDWPETETTFITGFRASPGNLAMAHHIIAYLIAPAGAPSVEAKDAASPGPGYNCLNGLGAEYIWLGSYVPGSQGFDYPAGTGVQVDPGSKIVLEIHYNMLATGPQPDVTSVDFKVDSSVDTPGRIMEWANPTWYYQSGGMHIPAGDPDVVYSWGADPNLISQPPQPLTIHSASLHMHTRGSRALLRIDRMDGTSECLLDIARWDFHWQGSYWFTTPKTIQPGDKVYIECHWDNTQANQPFVNGVQLPVQDVDWGESTTDEMCMATFFWTR